jgi:hypothetical protein
MRVSDGAVAAGRWLILGYVQVPRTLPVVIDDVPTVPDDAFADFGVTAFEGIRIAAAQAHEGHLLDGEGEVVGARRFEFQPGFSKLVGHFGCRILYGFEHLFEHRALGRFSDRKVLPLFRCWNGASLGHACLHILSLLAASAFALPSIGKREEAMVIQGGRGCRPRRGRACRYGGPATRRRRRLGDQHGACRGEITIWSGVVEQSLLTDCGVMPLAGDRGPFRDV